MTTPAHGILDGRYELREQIGRGGMGAVWLGRDTVLERVVAIKQIGLVAGGSEPNLLRAEREAHLAARVNHENVVAVYDLVHADDQQWLVMEHVDGPSLAGLIAQNGPMDPAELTPVMAQVASSLRAAHDHGIVHRDVKPSNILLTHEGVAKLSDFGIARTAADVSLTQTGLVSGSPAYLSPEVVTGRPATSASDVWSLGATMFHALAGRAPYESSDGVLDTMHSIVHDEPPRLRDHPALSPLVASMMQVDPEARPTMAQVQAALQPGMQPSETTEVHPVFEHATTASLRPLAPPDLPASTHRREPSRALWMGAIAAAVFVAAVVVVASGVLGGEDGGDSSSSASSTDPTAGAESDAATGPTAGALEGFASDYLTAADNDPEQGFALLTPAYQRESGGLDGYEDFWGGVDGLDIQQVSADPDALTVSYTYAYDYEGERRTEDVTLQLEQSGDDFLVAGAS